MALADRWLRFRRPLWDQVGYWDIREAIVTTLISDATIAVTAPSLIRSNKPGPDTPSSDQALEGTFMGRIYIDVEESRNCDYHPMQTFETRTTERTVSELWISGMPGKTGGHLVVGWSSDVGAEDGGPSSLTVVEVTDSGAAESTLVVGGDYGLRVKPEGSGEWSLNDGDQWGEPFMLLDPDSPRRETPSPSDTP